MPTFKRISPETDSRASTAGDEMDNKSVMSSRSLRSLTGSIGGFKLDGGNLKERIRGLEVAMEQQSERNTITDQTLDAIGADTEKVEANLKSYVNEVSEKLEAQVRQMKVEVDHRFELQDAENKRLQQHVATLKAENNQLQRKLAAMEDRVRNLEVEMGGGMEASRPPTSQTNRTVGSPNSPDRPITVG
mmetsp:Transcript_34537/g.35205  ORF Transcript_34537/g.35205 Transcript_34537/m.35205 type:complete len:189 (+) Transcript_34537:159-725(+)